MYRVRRKQGEINDSLGVCWGPDAALPSFLLLLKAGTQPRYQSGCLLEGGAGANHGSETTGFCEFSESLPT